MCRIWSMVFVLVFMLCGCSETVVMEKDCSDFFIWMDGYIAVPEKSTDEIPFTYYYTEGDYFVDPDAIESISLEQTDGVQLVSWRIEDIKLGEDAKYCAYSLFLTFSFAKQGIYRLRNIDFTLSDQTTQTYPIGTWVFDVGPVQEEYLASEIDIWSCSAVTNDSLYYKYQFPTGENVKITKLYYWDNVYIEDPKGIPTTSNVEIPNSAAPIKVIKPKLEIVVDDIPKLIYGNRSWCGALLMDESDVEASINYTKENTGADKDNSIL